MKTDPSQTRFTKKRYDATSAIYNIMEWPVEQLWYKRWRKELWREVKGPKVLEIGVGTGKNMPFHGDDLQVTAIDLSPGMLKRARKKRSSLPSSRKSRIQLREMDAQNMEFKENTFDEVVATFAFCSVPDPVLGLREARRVTRPGGQIHLLEHMRSRNESVAEVMKILDPPFHYLSGVHIARTTAENVEKAGWELTQVEDKAMNGVFRLIRAQNPEQGASA